jgi:gas vesicle protein
MTNKAKILLSVLGGAAAGSIISLLFAPAKGKETREKISDATQDLNEKILKRVQHLEAMLRN